MGYFGIGLGDDRLPVGHEVGGRFAGHVPLWWWLADLLVCLVGAVKNVANVRLQLAEGVADERREIVPAEVSTQYPRLQPLHKVLHQGKLVEYQVTRRSIHAPQYI